MAFIQAGQPLDVYLRILLFGKAGSGKTGIAGTFPAPLMIHASSEGGYKTFQQNNGTNLFPVELIGDRHQAWIQGANGGQKISDELSGVAQRLNTALSVPPEYRPFKTVVVGGLSVIQRMFISEAMKRYPSEKHTQKMWGYVQNVMLKLTQEFFALPCHVILEANSKDIVDDGRIRGYEPDLQGQGKNHVLNSVDLSMLVRQDMAGQVTGQIARSGETEIKKRFAAALGQHTLPIPQPSYDFFAEKLGLPAFPGVDPNHPRCRGLWPLGHQQWRPVS